MSPEAVFIDGTHIKANANMKKAVKKAVPTAAKRYEEELMKEINEGVLSEMKEMGIKRPAPKELEEALRLHEKISAKHNN